MAVVAAFAKKIAESSATLGPQEICMIMRGLGGVGVSNPAAVDLLRAFLPKLAVCDGQFNTQRYDVMMSGLLGFLRVLPVELDSAAADVDTLFQTIAGFSHKKHRVLFNSNEPGGSGPPILAELERFSGVGAAALKAALAHTVPTKATRDDVRSTRKKTSPHKGAAQGVREPQAAEGLGALLPGWTQHIDAGSGRAYYFHAQEGSRWDRPCAAGLLPDGWQAHVSPDGQPYYHHPTHGSSWVRPS